MNFAAFNFSEHFFGSAEHSLEYLIIYGQSLSVAGQASCSENLKHQKNNLKIQANINAIIAVPKNTFRKPSQIDIAQMNEIKKMMVNAKSFKLMLYFIM